MPSNTEEAWALLVELLPLDWQPYAAYVYAGALAAIALVSGVLTVRGQFHDARRKKREAEEAEERAERARLDRMRAEAELASQSHAIKAFGAQIEIGNDLARRASILADNYGFVTDENGHTGPKSAWIANTELADWERECKRLIETSFGPSSKEMEAWTRANRIVDEEIADNGSNFYPAYLAMMRRSVGVLTQAVAKLSSVG